MYLFTDGAEDGLPFDVHDADGNIKVKNILFWKDGAVSVGLFAELLVTFELFANLYKLL